MKANITHLIGQLVRGGAEKQLFHLATALQRRGWQQSVVSFSCRGPVGGPVSGGGYSPFRGSRVRRQALATMAASTRDPPLQGANPALLVRTRGRLWRWLFATGPMVRIFNLRGDLTNDIYNGVPRQNLGMLQATIERSDFVVSNSRRNLDVLREHGVRLPPTEVIYNMVFAQGCGKLHDLTAVPRIIAVGRLIPLKSYNVLLDAAALLAARAKPFELLLAGEGPERRAA